MVESVFMAELSWPEWEAKIAAGAIIFIPLGATEQHGPHLPLNVDVILPTAVCERVARNVGGLVAPTLQYGYKSMPRSGGGQTFPGTTSLDAQTFAHTLRDVIRDMGAHGARRFVVVNGHFENAWPSVEGLDLGLRALRQENIADVTAMRLEYWDFVRRETLDRIFPDGFPGTELEHASLIETSLMLLLRPTSWRRTRFRRRAVPASRPTTSSRRRPAICAAPACLPMRGARAPRSASG